MDVEKARVEQAAYDAGMTKTTQSLTAQLRDVAHALRCGVKPSLQLGLTLNQSLGLLTRYITLQPYAWPPPLSAFRWS